MLGYLKTALGVIRAMEIRITLFGIAMVIGYAAWAIVWLIVLAALIDTLIDRREERKYRRKSQRQERR